MISNSSAYTVSIYSHFKGTKGKIKQLKAAYDIDYGLKAAWDLKSEKYNNLIVFTLVLYIT